MAQISNAFDRPDYALLTTVPGIGQTLATVILLETGTIERFASPGNFASYARCVDSQCMSNGKKKGEGNKKNGNLHVRWQHPLFFVPVDRGQRRQQARRRVRLHDRVHDRNVTTALVECNVPLAKRGFKRHCEENAAQIPRKCQIGAHVSTPIRNHPPVGQFYIGAYMHDGLRWASLNLLILRPGSLTLLQQGSRSLHPSRHDLQQLPTQPSGRSRHLPLERLRTWV